MGDPVRLHQIILNLISNAVKFTNTGKIIVTVKLLDDYAESVNIEFSVADTGIGIHPQRIAEIFENFQQASSNTSRLYGGTGLGLAIVKQLVEGQKGKIEVKSELGVGSIFSFQMNFQKANEQPPFEEEIIVTSQMIKSLNVLVVEDIALNQLLMKTLLDDFEFGCDIASNGKIAIEKLKKNSYDIVLMDLQMPEMNGFEATAYIRNEMKLNLPIVALTADVTTVDLEKCKSVGMNDYIAKPVDEKLLFSKIVSLVKKYHQELKKDTLPNKSFKHFKYIDLDYLYQRTKSNPSLLIEIITLYLEQTPPLLDTMKKSLEAEDWEMLQAAAHKIIPSFSIMGISLDFENMAKKVQEHAINQQQKIEIVSLVNKLESALNEACLELKEELESIKNTKNGEKS
jgi:CheY-like chemotaxis protein